MGRVEVRDATFGQQPLDLWGWLRVVLHDKPEQVGHATEFFGTASEKAQSLRPRISRRNQQQRGIDEHAHRYRCQESAASRKCAAEGCANARPPSAAAPKLWRTAGESPHTFQFSGYSRVFKTWPPRRRCGRNGSLARLRLLLPLRGAFAMKPHRSPKSNRAPMGPPPPPPPLPPGPAAMKPRVARPWGPTAAYCSEARAAADPSDVSQGCEKPT